MAKKLTGSRPAPQRFWDLVEFAGPHECWIWRGAVQVSNGYGDFVISAVGGKRVRSTAHRCAWRYTFGPLAPGLQVNHHCDVRLCVNPAHLYAGSQAENMADMVRRGRAAGRERRALTPDQVREIRTSTESGRATAARFGVHEATISLVRSRKTYADVPD